MGKIERIEVPVEDREELRRLVRDHNTPQKAVWRARIVLLAGDGLGALEVAAEVGMNVLTVRRWRRRYSDKGVVGLLKDATRPARKKPLSAQTINKVVNMTIHEKPPKATHWSLRSMAKASGVSSSSVQRIWKAHELKPVH
jgi:transposase